MRILMQMMTLSVPVQQATVIDRLSSVWSWLIEKLQEMMLEKGLGVIVVALAALILWGLRRTRVYPRKLSQKQFKHLMGHGRFRSYGDTNGKRIVIKDRLSDGTDDGEYTLEELLFVRHPGQSISLYGTGGTGKTHQLLSLYNALLNDKKYKKTVPFYLELNEAAAMAPVEAEGDTLLPQKTETDLLIRSLAAALNLKPEAMADMLHALKEDCILLLDGFNEVVAAEKKQALANSICRIRTEYRTRVVLTSRIDHSDLFNTLGRGDGNVFVRAQVKKLTPQQIDEYLQQAGLQNVQYRTLSPSSRRLLTTVQGLSMYAALLQGDSSLNITTMGGLLRMYSQKLILTGMQERMTHRYEKCLQAAAYYMVRQGRFSITEQELDGLLDDAELECLLSFQGGSGVNALFMAEDGQGDSYEFSHQNFRDMYCALALLDAVKNLDNRNYDGIADSYFRVDNVTGNGEILSLCADLLDPPSCLQRAVNVLKTVETVDYSYLLSVLIRIHALRSDGDISQLDLSRLDLRKVSLSNYRLCVRTRDGKTRAVRLDGTRLSHDTFLQNGLQKGSSTICTYRKDGREYVAAFCSHNALVYDIEASSWRCIRSWCSHGWINCCCPAQLAGRDVILLGCDDGNVVVFDPITEQIDEGAPITQFAPVCRRAYDKKYAQAGVHSIVCVPDVDGGSAYVASNGCGDVFLLGSDRVLLQQDSAAVDAVRAAAACAFLKVFSPCRLAVAADLNGSRLLMTFGDTVCAMQLPLREDSAFTPVLQTDGMILDIACTGEYVFLNMGSSVVAYDMELTPLAAYVAAEKGLDHFTKLSLTDDPAKILTGVFAKDMDRNELPSFYELLVVTHTNEDFVTEYALQPNLLQGSRQTKATYTGVYFRPQNHTGCRLATTSDDRTVQILAPYEEDVPVVRHEGSQDGVHYIEPVSADEFFAAQYDGTVTHWKYAGGQWRCLDAWPLHTDWVWKIACLDRADGRYLVSCSYDGSLRLTSLTGDSSRILVETDRPVLDFALCRNETGHVTAITAISSDRVFCCDPDTGAVKTHALVEAPDCYFRACVSVGDRVLVAASFGSSGRPAEVYSIVPFDSEGLKSLCVTDFKFLRELAVDAEGTLLSAVGYLRDNTYYAAHYPLVPGAVLPQDGPRARPDQSKQCTAACEGRVFTGWLDGTVLVANADESLHSRVQTRAKLLSTAGVNLARVAWASAQQKEDFVSSFGGYFSYK